MCRCQAISHSKIFLWHRHSKHLRHRCHAPYSQFFLALSHKLSQNNVYLDRCFLVDERVQTWSRLPSLILNTRELDVIYREINMIDGIARSAEILGSGLAFLCVTYRPSNNRLGGKLTGFDIHWSALIKRRLKIGNKHCAYDLCDDCLSECSHLSSSFNLNAMAIRDKFNAWQTWLASM